VLWAAVAVPHHRPIVNRDRLKSLIRQGDYPAAVAFASSKSRVDFPSIYPLPPGDSFFQFPLELLNALPADAPVWLRKEWTSQAVEWFSSNWPRNEKEQAELRFHPNVWDGLRQHAQSLRGRTDLRGSEKHWLEKFEKEEERLKATL
jgi:hypothetical protein